MLEGIKAAGRRVLGLGGGEAGGEASAGLTARAQREWLDIFYGRPAWADGKTHLCGFGAMVAGHAATMAASEIEMRFCAAGGGKGDGQLAAYLQGQLDASLAPGLRNAIQLAAAGGWAVLKPYVRGGQILCEVLGADAFAPLEMAGGRLEAAVFIDRAVAGGKPYIRLETHRLLPEGVLVTNRAYREDAGRAATDYAGRPEAPLGILDRWAGLAPEALVRGALHPLYGVLKMPFANTVEPGSPLPVALYAGAVGSLREMDRIFSEFLWEVKSGHRRQILDITAVRPRAARGGERPEYEAGDQYLVLDMGGRETKPYDDYTPQLRIEQYQAALNLQLRLLERQCGLSAESLGFDLRRDLGREMTAAQVLGEQKETYNTIKAIQEGGLRRGLEDVMAVYRLYAGLYGLAPGGGVNCLVSFGDSVFEDTGVEFARRKCLADEGYIRREALTGWYFGVSEEEARRMAPEGR